VWRVDADPEATVQRSGLRNVLKYLHREALRQGAGLSDGCLLERFVHSRDEAAFELLVWRHGPLVMNVCRRLLRCDHDVEDAFQATFAALACKARTIRKQSTAAPWLYRVAYRAALAARAKANRHIALLPEAEPLAAADDDWLWRDLGPVLDAEVQKLAEKYRSAFVLCCLEGLTHGEAAARLGCPEGTIHSRLATARAQLRRRLEHRGVTLSGMGLAFEFGSRQAIAPPTVQLVQQTLTVACSMATGPIGSTAVKSSIITLTKGVLLTMWIQSYTAPALVTLALCLVGVGVAGYQRSAGSSVGDEPAGRAAQPDTRRPPALPQVQPANVEKSNAEEAREPTAGMDLDNTLLKLMMDEQALAKKYGPEHLEILKLREQIKFLHDLIARREASKKLDQTVGNQEVIAQANKPTKDQTAADLAAQLQSVLSEMTDEQQGVTKYHLDRRRSLALELYTSEEQLKRLDQQTSFERERQKKKLEALLAEEIETEKSIRAAANPALDKQLKVIQELIARATEEMQARQLQYSKQAFELRMSVEAIRLALKSEDDKWARESATRESLLSQMRTKLITLNTTARYPQLATILTPVAEDNRVGSLESKLDEVIRELTEVKKQLAKTVKE
jgi:RNA polymerase sigma factor (sigma-70 family)